MMEPPGITCATQLPEPLTKQQVSLSDVAACNGGKALLVVFICNHCPFVVAIIEALEKVAKDYESKGLAAVAISSNSVQTHPQGDAHRHK